MSLFFFSVRGWPSGRAPAPPPTRKPSSQSDYLDPKEHTYHEIDNNYLEVIDENSAQTESVNKSGEGSFYDNRTLDDKDTSDQEPVDRDTSQKSQATSGSSGYRSFTDRLT